MRFLARPKAVDDALEIAAVVSEPRRRRAHEAGARRSRINDARCLVRTYPPRFSAESRGGGARRGVRGWKVGEHCWWGPPFQGLRGGGGVTDRDRDSQLASSITWGWWPS